MNLYGFALSAALALAVDAVFSALLQRKFRELVGKGYSPVFPFSVMQLDRVPMPVPGDKRSMLSFASTVVAFWTFLEESVFRVVPYVAAGLPGALAGTVAWALSHAAKFHQYNAGLPEREYWGFAKVYLAGLTATGAVWALSMPLSEALWAPYVFHVAHNSAALASLSRMVSVPKRGFLKEATVHRKPAKPVKSAGNAGYAPKWSGRIRLEYLD